MIDWDRVEELRDEIGHEDFDELVELFFAEVEEAVARLRAPGAAAEREADLHALKGSSSNLGFTELGRLCAEAELLAAGGEVDEGRIAEVIATYESSRSAFAEGTRAAA